MSAELAREVAEGLCLSPAQAARYLAVLAAAISKVLREAKV